MALVCWSALYGVLSAALRAMLGYRRLPGWRPDNACGLCGSEHQPVPNLPRMVAMRRR